MKLKLSEDPKEWRKFAVAGAAFAFAGLGLMWVRKPSMRDELSLAFVAVGAVLVVSVVWPRLIRPVYRLLMTGSFHLGQVMGRLLLGVMFLFVLTPIACLLRALGKDVLGLRRSAPTDSYWKPVKASEDFDRQF